MHPWQWTRTNTSDMAINWNAFYANGGYSNENSDPRSYDDGEDDTYAPDSGRETKEDYYEGD